MRATVKCGVTTCGHALVESSWNVMVHGDARDGKWMGKLVNGMGSQHRSSVASTLHTTSEHGVSSITTADAHTSAASSLLNWHPCRFQWAHPFCRKTKSGFCAWAIIFHTQSSITVTECCRCGWRNIHYVHKEVILEDGSVISSAPRTHEHKHVMSQWISAVGVAPVYYCNYLN